MGKLRNRFVSRVAQYNNVSSGGGTRYLHMQEAWSSAQGDDEEYVKLSHLVMDVLALIPAELQFISCTVPMSDLQAVKPRLSQDVTAERVCAESCFSMLRIPVSPQSNHTVNLVYDRNEGFLRYIDRPWRATPKPTRVGWKREVGDIRQDDSKQTPEIQLADLAGWITNRHFTVGDAENWWFSLQLSTMRNSRRTVYDANGLLANYGDGGRLFSPKN